MKHIYRRIHEDMTDAEVFNMKSRSQQGLRAFCQKVLLYRKTRTAQMRKSIEAEITIKERRGSYL